MSAPWNIDVVTLFPQYLEWMRDSRPIRNAIEAGELELGLHDLRSHSQLKHRQVDDEPYGGGAGMVMRVDVVAAAVEAICGTTIEKARDVRRIVALTPAGERFDDAMASRWARERRPTLILCGRYEGLDHRIHEHIATEEVSVGPYVLSGGEIAAMAMIDATARKLPGALGNPDSLTEESFSCGADGALEYPHYTRPAEFRGWTVPEVLLSGHHGRVAEWRREQSGRRTQGR